MKANEWYSIGVRFECMRCGKCCEEHGEYTYVYMISSDIESISRFLGLTGQEFITAYCLQHDDLTFLKIKNDQCPFSKNGGCTVYEVRPVQCRTWPFWMPNLIKETWDNDVVPICPGIGRGKLYTRDEIEVIAIKSEEGFDELLT
jgi:Fe-S-cluster containining protein